MRTPTIAFRPAKDVRSLLSKASKRLRGVSRSRLINMALREAFQLLRGKREGSL